MPTAQPWDLSMYDTPLKSEGILSWACLNSHQQNGLSSASKVWANYSFTTQSKFPRLAIDSPGSLEKAIFLTLMTCKLQLSWHTQIWKGIWQPCHENWRATFELYIWRRIYFCQMCHMTWRTNPDFISQKALHRGWSHHSFRQVVVLQTATHFDSLTILTQAEKDAPRKNGKKKKNHLLLPLNDAKCEWCNKVHA